MKQLIKKIFQKYLLKKGLQITPIGEGYFSPGDVVPKAEAANLSLAEYLENNNIGGVGRRRDTIVAAIAESVLIRNASLLEIGTGTGMYLEKLYKEFKCTNYEVYETNWQWVDYLKKHYAGYENIKFRPADGKSLSYTPSETIDIVSSHGVFVYLPILVSINYLHEMYRVCKKGGYIIFDCFTDENFGLAAAQQWYEDNYQYVFPVVTPISLINDFKSQYNLALIATFNVPYHSSISTYFIFFKPYD